MKKLFIVLPRRWPFKTFAYILLAVCISIVTFFIILSCSNYRLAIAIASNDTISQLQNENNILKGILSSLLPKKNEIIYEDAYRSRYINTGVQPPENPFKTYSLPEVLNKGLSIKFNIIFDDPQYQRPIYDPSWKSTYYRLWLYLPYKNIEARHRLFTYYGGLSNIYDFEGSLGFHRNVSVDYHRNINFLVYNFKANSIKKYKNQIVIVGDTARTGAQIIAVKVNDVLPPGSDTGDFLFQLSTGKGYEVDYEYGGYAKSDYLKRLEKKESDKTTSEEPQEPQENKFLKNENAYLKEELSNYVPIKDEALTQQMYKIPVSGFTGEPTDIGTVWSKGKKLAFTVNYENKHYKRPVYDPSWKENSQKKWGYIPKQIYLNQNKILIIPDTPEKQEDLFGALAFQEGYKLIGDNEIGLLIYNYTVTEAVDYKGQVVLTGNPSRNGAQIISFDKKDLHGSNCCLFQLATPDGYELDYQVFK